MRKSDGRFGAGWLFTLAVASVLVSVPIAAHATIYTPGATTDPDCGPHEANCGVATTTATALPALSQISTSLTGLIKATAGTLSAALVDLTADVTGILPVSHGGTGVAALKAGFITFGNDAGALATSTALYFDTANTLLGVGTSSPFTTLSVQGNTYISGALNVGATSTTRSNIGVDYAATSNILNVSTGAVVTISTWGDSLTSGNQDGTGVTFETVLGPLTGQTVLNGGVSGQTSPLIATRMRAASSQFYNPTIIWAGRNDYSDAAAVESNINSMVSALQSVGNNNFVILSILNSSSEPSGTGNYSQISAINNYLAATYGSHYLDVRAFLISNGLSDAGLTPTAQDLTDIANDVIPTSLRYDTLHLNGTGYTEVAKFLYRNRSLLQKATAPESVLSVSGLRSLFRSPLLVSNFIGTDRYSGFQQDGNTVLYASTTNWSVAIGASSAAAWIAATSTQTNAIAIGQGALATSPMVAANDIAIGANALNVNTTGTLSIAIGTNALQSNTSGSQNVALGPYALQSNLSGLYNSAVGASALLKNTTGNGNSGLGLQALYSNTTGNNNIAIGTSALYYNTQSVNSVAAGYAAAMGASAYHNQGGVYVGYNSGGKAANGSDYNTFIGYQAGYLNTTGSGNILIGPQINNSGIGYISTGMNNIGIGFNTLFPDGSGNNQFNIGNFVFGQLPATSTAASLILPTTGKLGVGTSSPYAEFSIHANNGSSYSALFAVGSSTASATTTLFRIANTGDVTINGSSGSTCTIGNGTGGTSCSSDQRLKTNITEISDALTKVGQLKGVTFNWADSTKSQATYLGVIAQDVQKVFPQAVVTQDNGYLAVDYGALVAPLIEAVKEIASISGTFKANLVAWLGNPSNGVQEVDMQRLCVGGTCITGAQLQQLMQNSGMQSSYVPPAASPITVTDASTTEPVASSTPANENTEASSTQQAI